MSNTSHRSISLYTATSIVIANMVGTGVFTSLGFQVQGIKDPTALVLLWIIGGITALCGALTYAELGSVFPRSGGEYEYLRKTYHPLLGFLSGWISATVGFAAPVALAAVAFGAYMSKVIPSFPPHWAAIVLIWLLSALHSVNQHAGFRFQRWFTAIKISLILLFVLCGLLAAPQIDIHFIVTNATWDVMKTSAFAVSLVFVAYAYSGWNAAAYVAGEIENPRKNLPSALLTGTLLVTLLYTLLNITFLKTIPIETLATEQASDFSKPLEVAYFSAETFLGESGAAVMAVIIAILLVSTISAMVIAGPRVTQIMGRDLPVLAFLGKNSRRSTPANAIIFQGLIASVLVLTSKFDDILVYIGFTLQFFTFLAVLGTFILRIRGAEIPFRMPLFPLPALLFLALTGWSMYYIFVDKPEQSLWGLLSLVAGIVVYATNEWFVRRNTTNYSPND